MAANERRFTIVIGGEDRTAGAFKSSESGATRLGTTLTKTLTPAAAAMGLVFRQSFKEWDAGADALRAGTGATGEALKSLENSMKRVGGQVTQGLGEIGTVMADVNTRTGLTGKSLEVLTKQLLDLNRMGNPASAESVTRVFGDWGIAAENSTGALDKLFRASQATGPSVDRLGQLMVQYGAPMRQLGFSFEHAAAMLGKFEKEGVNTELVMGSLRIALGKMARSGEDAESTFSRVVEEIKNAGSASEANALALELFGARAGPDMAAAIREGRFELGELFDQVSNGTETVAKAANDTLDWSDKLTMLKNRVHGVLGPVGELGMGVAGLAAGLGPMLMLLGKVGPMLLTLAGNPIVLAVAGIAALAAGLIYAYQHSETFRNVVDSVFRFISSAAQTFAAIVTGALSWVRDNFDKLLIAIGPVGWAVLLLKENFAAAMNGVRVAVQTAWDVIRPILKTMTAAIDTAAGAVKGITGAVGKVGGGISGAVGAVGGLFRASGGPVAGGSPYIVGERGPELFVPGMSGMIVPNHAMGGNNYNISVQVAAGADAAEVGRATVEAIKEYERRNGPSWRAA